MTTTSPTTTCHDRTGASCATIGCAAWHRLLPRRDLSVSTELTIVNGIDIATRRVRQVRVGRVRQPSSKEIRRVFLARFQNTPQCPQSHNFYASQRDSTLK